MSFGTPDDDPTLHEVWDHRRFANGLCEQLQTIDNVLSQIPSKRPSAFSPNFLRPHGMRCRILATIVPTL